MSLTTFVIIRLRIRVQSRHGWVDHAERTFRIISLRSFTTQPAQHWCQIPMEWVLYSMSCYILVHHFFWGQFLALQFFFWFCFQCILSVFVNSGRKKMNYTFTYMNRIFLTSFFRCEQGIDFVKYILLIVIALCLKA